MTRVIHTGDTHLGYRQYHAPERREDFLAAFRRVVSDAIDDEVDAVVHAGDLFHDRTPDLSDVHGAIRILRDLRDAEIPFLAIVGNHERTRGGQWLDLFETLGLATRLDDEPTRIGDVAFYGLDFVPRSKRDALEYDFDPHEGDFAALVAHGPFEPFVPEVRNDRWDLPAVLEAANVAFDAALLGDDHTADTVRIGETWATYCGSTERVDAGERDDRGYNVVEFDGDVRISRRGLETRPFVTVDLELAPGEGIDRVRERIREEDVEDAVVVVRIEGDGEDVHPARVEEFAAERGALIARVSDRRDVETAETAPDVSFADPDEAVRDRIQEMGLSPAAVTIDATVRDDGIADANVRDRVRERVEELVDDDPGAFERPEVEDEEAGEDGGGDTGDVDAGDGGAEADAGTDAEEDGESLDGATVDGEDDDVGADEEGVDDENIDAPATVEAASEAGAADAAGADEPDGADGTGDTDEADESDGTGDVGDGGEPETGETEDPETDTGGATTIEDFL